MLRLMLASPAGAPAVLAGRALAAALVGFLQGGIVLACAPLVVAVEPPTFIAAAGALALACLSSSVLGLLVAVRLRSVENFAGVINVVLFPLLFVSGALYATRGMPHLLRLLAQANPVTYQVDLMRHAFGQPAEFLHVGPGQVLVQMDPHRFFGFGHVQGNACRETAPRNSIVNLITDLRLQNFQFPRKVHSNLALLAIH